MGLLRRLVCVSFALLSVTSGALHAESSELFGLKKRILDEKIGGERAWRKLLLIPDRWYASDRSLVDDPHFFLAPDGRSDPQAELLATLEGLFAAPRPSQEAISCRFPARAAWIKERLGISAADLPAQDCPETKKFIDFLQYQGASLVFSNYFVDSPASMFGHSFIRLHRSVKDRSDQALLDDSINYAAAVSEEQRDWLYPIKGLAGGFVGRFSLLPYYRKIQEYNNYESRDLWEYELRLTPAELRRLEQVLWEMGPLYLDYYYLDDNCSYIMLALLEAAKPDLRLTGQLSLYAIPADTVRALTRVSDFVGKVNYRPSSLSRYLNRSERLHEGETQFLEAAVKKEDWDNSRCDAVCEARVIDTALEYIDFKEKLSGSRIPEHFASWRNDLLQRRAKTKVLSETFPMKPFSSQPEQGHDAGMLSLRGGAYRDGGAGTFIDLHWRSALHELEARSEGYSDGLSIGFLDTLLRYDGKDKIVRLKEVHALEIMSIPHQVPLLPTWAWHFDFGYDRGFGRDRFQDRGRSYVQGGAGPSASFFNKTLLTFALLEADIGHGSELGAHAGPGLSLGGLLSLGDWGKLTLRSEIFERYGRRFKAISREHTLGFSLYPSPNAEMRLQIADDQGQQEARFAILGYF